MNQIYLNERLFSAARRNDREAAKEAINEGADVNAKDRYGYTPLRLAELWGKTETADLIRQHGGTE